jgi:hypothetical protein
METFDNWVRGIASQALMKGVVDMENIERICKVIDKEAYRRGYDKGHNDGYAQAVVDAQRESNQ